METFFTEGRFRALVENILDVIAVLSLDGTYLYCSASVSKTLGYAPEELTGKNALGMIHPADLPRGSKIFGQVLLNPGERIFTQLRYRHKDGSWRWLEGVIFNMLNDPDIRGIVVNYRDVTNSRLEDEKTRQRAEQMTVLYKTTQDLVMERDSHRLLHKIVERAVTLLEVDSGSLYLSEPEYSQVRCVVSYRTRKDYTDMVLKYGEGAAGKVAKTRKPLIIDDYPNWEGRARVVDEKDFSALLSVPIIYQNELIGVLHILDDNQTRKFNESDLRIASLFANQAAIAVANARLIEQVQNRSVELEQNAMELAHSNILLASLHSVAASLMVSRGRDEILNILSAELTRLGFGHEITLYDPETNELVIQHLSVQSRIMKKLDRLFSSSAKGFRGSAGAPFLAELLESGSPRFMEDPRGVFSSLPFGVPTHLARKFYNLAMGSSSPVPTIFLPMKIGERKIGLMAVWERDLKPQDVDIFLVFVAQVTVALENSRLLDSEHQHSLELAHSNTLLASLHSIAAGLTVSRGSEEILSILSTELKRLDIGHGITLYDPETDELVSQYVSVDSEQLDRLETLLGPRISNLRVGHRIKGRRTSARIPFIAELLETGTARYMRDFLEAVELSSIPLAIPRALLPQAMKLVLGASSIPLILLPLKVQERKIGLMAVWGCDLKPEDVDIFVVFVTQVAIALDNSRLLDLERQRASELENKVNERTSQLTSLLQEKEILLREVYHRVKNNLQVVNSLLSLQMPQLETDSDRQIFVDTRERVKAMAMVHEKLYRSGDLARVDFSEYVQGLVGNLARVYIHDARDVNIKVNVEKIWLGLDTAIPCGLILNELVANSFKHAFPNPNEIRKPEVGIDLTAESGGRYTLTIADNGVGIPGNMDWRNTQTMGLQLVTMLMEQLDAEIRLTRHTGTKFAISFSEMKYKERN